MLPFLRDKKNSASITTIYRKPDESKEPADESDVGMHAAAKDLLKAIAENDHIAVAKAWKAGHEIMLSSVEHEEPSEDSLVE